MKILIIDDEGDIRRIARLSLTRIGGMEVVEAESGGEGVQKAVEEKPDCVLLDMMMPAMDGPSTLMALKNHPSTAEIPVIFLTAKAMPAEIERLKLMGALGVLTKPFDPVTLPVQIRTLLGK